MKLSNVLSLALLLSSAQNSAADGHLPCLGACSTTDSGEKECTFTVKLDLHASELGYYHFEECAGTNPTLGKLKIVSFIPIIMIIKLKSMTNIISYCPIKYRYREGRYLQVCSKRKTI